MKSLLPVFVFIMTAAFSGCRGHSSEISKQIETFSRTPPFIKSFLNMLEGGQFLIAEKGADWTSGCVAQRGVPRRQFVSASLHSNQYELIFWEGGFVDARRKLLIEYTDTVVNSYTFRDL